MDKVVLPWNFSFRSEEVILEQLPCTSSRTTVAVPSYLAESCQSLITMQLISPSPFQNIASSILSISKPWWTVHTRLCSSKEVMESYSSLCISDDMLWLCKNGSPENPPPCCQDTKAVLNDPSSPAEPIIENSFGLTQILSWVGPH